MRSGSLRSIELLLHSEGRRSITMPWTVVGIGETESSSDRATASAAVVQVERDDEERRIVVELLDSADAAGKPLNAQEAVRNFLENDEPPKRLVVTTHGVSAAVD
jgi:hypothetical protein